MRKTIWLFVMMISPVAYAQVVNPSGAPTTAQVQAAINGQPIAPSTVAAGTAVSAPLVTISGTPTNPTDAVTVGYVSSHAGASVIASLAAGNTGAQNTAVIRAAIALLPSSNGTVVLPPGTFALDNTTSNANVFASSVVFEGAGRGNTILTKTNQNDYLFKFQGVSQGSHLEWAGLTDVSVRGAGSGTGGGVYFQYVQHPVMQNIEVSSHGSGGSGDCIYADNIYHGEFVNGWVNSCGSSALHLHNGIYAVRFSGFDFHRSSERRSDGRNVTECGIPRIIVYVE